MNIKNIDSLSLEECQKLLAANPNDEQLQTRCRYLQIKHVEELRKNLAVKERNLQSILKQIDLLEYEKKRIDDKLHKVAIQRDINEKKLERSNTFKYLFLITTFLFFISTIFFLVRYRSISKNTDSIHMQDSLDINTIHIKDLVDAPIIVTDIAIGNSDNDGGMETEYGETIEDVNTMFLKPKITYVGANDGPVTLYYKIQRLSDNYTSVSEGSEYMIYTGKNTLELDGWGNKKPGNWEAGKYVISIWYCDKKIAEDTFDIHKSQDSE